MIYRAFLCLIAVLFSAFACVSMSQAQDDVAIEATQSFEVGPAKLQQFRKALVAAAEQSQKAGEITRGELFKLRIASLSPSVLKQMHQAVAEQALSEGKFQSVQAVDWSQLIAFIKEILPVILQLIDLFS